MFSNFDKQNDMLLLIGEKHSKKILYARNCVDVKTSNVISESEYSEIYESFLTIELMKKEITKYSLKYFTSLGILSEDNFIYLIITRTKINENEVRRLLQGLLRENIAEKLQGKQISLEDVSNLVEQLLRRKGSVDSVCPVEPQTNDEGIRLSPSMDKNKETTNGEIIIQHANLKKYLCKKKALIIVIVVFVMIGIGLAIVLPIAL